MSHIDVCICTFRRPDLLRRLLTELKSQVTLGAFSFSIVVVDNDAAGSARTVVAEACVSSAVTIDYIVEPKQNIALARNRAIGHSSSTFFAFIDDDEYPQADWLAAMFDTISRQEVAGVLGPVIPYYETKPPAWIERGHFFDRPRHQTGTFIDRRDFRTGNVLVRRSILSGEEEAFRAEFGTGGEDVDFFARMSRRGWQFAWCDEAVVYEFVPSDRCTRRYLLRRALLRGEIASRRRPSRILRFLTSAVAVPVYLGSLPVLWLLGEDVGMRYLIKTCDHLGRILGTIGVRPVRSRDF